MDYGVVKREETGEGERGRVMICNGVWTIATAILDAYFAQLMVSDTQRAPCHCYLDGHQVYLTVTSSWPSSSVQCLCALGSLGSRASLVQLGAHAVSTRIPRTAGYCLSSRSPVDLGSFSVRQSPEQHDAHISSECVSDATIPKSYWIISATERCIRLPLATSRLKINPTMTP